MADIMIAIPGHIQNHPQNQQSYSSTLKDPGFLGLGFRIYSLGSLPPTEIKIDQLTELLPAQINGNLLLWPFGKSQDFCLAIWHLFQILQPIVQ
jgi:hypothetical protein